MVIRENYFPTPQEAPPAPRCSFIHQWQFKRDANGNFDRQLKWAIRHVVTNSHEIEGQVYGGYQVDESLSDKLSLIFFQKVGLLEPLTAKFRGDINAVVDYAFPKESPVNGNEEACAHHWKIETPAGPTSEGSCQLCGETRSFNNSRDWLPSDYGQPYRVEHPLL